MQHKKHHSIKIVTFSFKIKSYCDFESFTIYGKLKSAARTEKVTDLSSYYFLSVVDVSKSIKISHNHNIVVPTTFICRTLIFLKAAV